MTRLSDEMLAANRELEGKAKSALGEMIAGLRPWDVFGTMTYDQSRYPKERMWGSYEVPKTVSGDRAKKDAMYWVNDASGALGRRIEYVCGMEYQKNGWPHFHTLLDLGGLENGDIRKIGPLWYARYGYDRLEIPRSLNDCAAVAESVVMCVGEEQR